MTRREITVTLAPDTPLCFRRTVRADVYSGVLAVHRTVQHRTLTVRKRSFLVTHIPSGLSMSVSYDRKSSARALAVTLVQDATVLAALRELTATTATTAPCYVTVRNAHRSAVRNIRFSGPATTWAAS
jgi:hypothetical protein